jgi:hypothetical protein
VTGRVGPPGRGGGPGTALMPLVPCWPDPRHCKARRPIKPIGPDCAPTTGGADPSLAAMRLPAACGRRGGRGSGRRATDRGGGGGGRRAASPWRSHRGGGGRRGLALEEEGRQAAWLLAVADEEAAGRPGHGGGGGGRLGAKPWRRSWRPERHAASQPPP